MPGHYGRSSSGGSRGSAAPGGTGGWSPGVGGQQPKTKTNTYVIRHVEPKEKRPTN